MSDCADIGAEADVKANDEVSLWGIVFILRGLLLPPGLLKFAQSGIMKMAGKSNGPMNDC